MASHSPATVPSLFLPTVDLVALFPSIHVPFVSPEDDPMIVHGSVFRVAPSACSILMMLIPSSVQIFLKIPIFKSPLFQYLCRSTQRRSISSSPVLEHKTMSLSHCPTYSKVFSPCLNSKTKTVLRIDKHVFGLRIPFKVWSLPSSLSFGLRDHVDHQASTPVGSYYPPPSVAPTITYGQPYHYGVISDNAHPVQ
jgi:hypothetical protein